jgi:Uma2 family endonuclease
MPTVEMKLGPADQGRRMRLAEFDQAETEEGYFFELSRGIIVVSQVPEPRHFAMVNGTRRQIQAYDLAYPGRNYGIAGGGECKLLLDDWDSERHPDLAIYTVAPPRGKNVWARWIPDLVIEVVSPGSEERDYILKREEYLALRVKEYWILDVERREMLVLRRVRNRWVERIVQPPEPYSCRHLPGLIFDCGSVFQAAEEV